jgi:small-conductance mechanosensitive channel
MKELLERVASLSLSAKLASAVLGILVIHAAFRLLETTLPRHFQQADARYRVRKVVVFLGYGVGLLFLVTIFEDRLGSFTFALGVAGAGIVVALQDVIASFGGWFAIGAAKLFTVGDRIQIGDTIGDVIDISMLRTTVLEVGNWVSKDLHSGRVARIPNHLVLKGPVFNYTQGVRFVWDEIKVTLTAQSDHTFARSMLLEIARQTVADSMEEARHTWKSLTDNYRIENPDLEPIVALAVNGGGLDFTVSYIVDYARRTVTKDRLFTNIADQIANSQGRIEWASSSSPSRSQAGLQASPAAARHAPNSIEPSVSSRSLEGRHSVTHLR